MASVPDENSPPRHDPLSKARRQSTLLDSPSRVTRSQVRRLSSAPVEASMSPKPSTRRRSTIAPASKNDTATQDEVSSVQEETDTVKTLPRRRSVRKSFADATEDGPLSSHSSKLTSIDEDSKASSIEESKPVTRRTRASLRTPLEPEPELSLPTTRRTRRSSLSSVSSSIVASPKRQTRSRKNLSPVPSPTFSEVSTMSEVPETSPATRSSPTKGDSPMTKKSEKLLGTPRQLELNDLESAKAKRSPFVVSEVVQSYKTGSPSQSHDVGTCQSQRNSRGRQSLKSPLNFLETAIENTEMSNPDAEKASNDNDGEVEMEINKSRGSIGRSSLSSNKSSRLSLSSNKSSRLSLSSNKSSPSPNKLSPMLLEKFEKSPHLALNGSRRSSIGRLSLSSNKASPTDGVNPAEHEDSSKPESRSPIVMINKLMNDTDFADSPRQISTHSQRESTGRLTRKSSPFKFEVSDRVSPKKPQIETSSSEVVSSHETSEEIMPSAPIPLELKELSSSTRTSTGKISKEKLPYLKSQESHLKNVSIEDSSMSDEVSTEQQVFDVEDSSTDPGSVEVVIDKRNSVGRLSLSANKGTSGKHQTPDGSPKLSMSANKSTPAQFPKFNDEADTDSQKHSMKRFSLSNKSTPAKSPKGEVAPQEDIVTPNTLLSRFSLSSSKLSPANSPKCDASPLPNAFLSRFSLSLNKSTPAKASPAKSPKCEDTPQLQLNESHRSLGRLSLSSTKSLHSSGFKADESKHFSDNEESVSSSDSSGQNVLDTFSLSTDKVGKTSPRKSAGRASLTPSMSFNNSPHQLEEASNNVSNTEESDSVTSSDAVGQSVSVEKLNSSNKAENPSPRKAEGRPSLTPKMPLHNSNPEEEGASSDSSDDTCDKSRNLFSGFSSNLNRSEVSRRASTGNLSSKLLKTDLKKSRASMGPLIDPLVSYVPNSEDKDDMSDSSDDIGDSSNAGDKHRFAAGELTLSPIKQDLPSKKTSLTPSLDKSVSESERQNSPNNPFEKSTVFNDDSFASNETSEQALETSVSSHKSSNINLIRNDEENVSIADDQASESHLAKDVSREERNLVSSVGKTVGSTGVYKAAALLMSGGNISDFDDNDDGSDDDQFKWQPVFSKSTLTKKEKKLEKKARKKAEKEARKKREQEKSLETSVAVSKSSVFCVSDTQDGPSVIIEENILPKSDSLSPTKMKKTKSMELNLVSNEVSIQRDEELNLSEKTTTKRRKTLSLSESDLPLEDSTNFTHSPLKKNKSLLEEIILSAKKINKRKSGIAEFETGDLAESEISNTLSIADDGDSAGKKRQKKSKTIPATEMQSTQENAPLKKKKKKTSKRKVVDDHVESETFNTPIVANNSEADTTGKKKKKKSKDVTATEMESTVEKATLKNKKKKLDKRVLEEELPRKKKKQITSQNQIVEENTVEMLKMKKKKKRDMLLQPCPDSEQNFNDELQGKKKSKKMKFSNVETMNIDKKSRIKMMTEADETIGTLKKKSKKIVDKKLICDENKDVPENQPKKIKNKKGKERVVLESPVVAADNSDDEPTSVSFTASKSAALAMMEAAAENIKKQKELRKQKLRERQEKFNVERSIKKQKLKEMFGNEDVESSSSEKVVFPGTTKSSKIYFDETGKAQKKKHPKRLPAELLESLSDQPPTKLVKRLDGSKQRVPVTAASSEEEKRFELIRAKKLARKLEKQNLLQSDYVPLEGVLGSTRFGVVPLRNVMLAKKLEKNKLAEEAANFRQQSLFGSRIRRTPISASIAYQDKLKASGKGRFVN